MITDLIATTPTPKSENLRNASTRIRRAAAVIASIAASTATWFVLTDIFGLAVEVPSYSGTLPGTTALGLGQVIVTTVVTAGLGWGVLAALERFSVRARKLWTIIAPVAAVASLLLPLTAPALTQSQRLSLVVFHVVVASLLILALRATLADRDPSPIRTGSR